MNFFSFIQGNQFSFDFCFEEADNQTRQSDHSAGDPAQKRTESLQEVCSDSAPRLLLDQ